MFLVLAASGAVLGTHFGDFYPMCLAVDHGPSTVDQGLHVRRVRQAEPAAR